jgi:hypothetical protein
LSNNKLEKNEAKPPSPTLQDEKYKLFSDNGLWRWTGFGVEFIGVMGLFTYVGRWADQKFGTGPWLMVAGFFIAFIGMIYLVIKETLKWRK